MQRWETQWVGGRAPEGCYSEVRHQSGWGESSDKSTFDSMSSRGAQPTTVTYAAVISVLARMSLWQPALAVLEESSKQQSCRVVEQAVRVGLLFLRFL
eukprot:s6733_g2.t1